MYKFAARLSFLTAAGAALMAALPTIVVAQDNWPAKPITMVVPFPPGGVADTVGRPVAQAMARELKQSVIVENKAGAGGAIGMAAVAKAPPDGYTVLMSLASMTTIPEADKVNGKTSLFQLSQLKPIARFTADPVVLVVRSDAPWKNLQEFVADMKSKPGKFSFASSGNYGTMHVPMEMLKSRADFRMLHVPYTGAGPALVALLSGQVDAVATGPASVLQQIKAGKLKALAHWGEGPLASLPGVPTLKQAGYPLEYAQWAGLFVPAGTPDAVVEKLRAAAHKAADDPAVNAAINGSGSSIMYMDAPEFQTYLNADARKMADVVQKIGKVE
ncbi:tripartite tricarboxylate transporter substrate binding protein [Noviherbaspirillum sp. L7-7A]|uniref:tripartite tricarboxylate transporter substrate binding protein n=1 Tax=Noviherbaspirillum sp. L7-7A TaxID=2850560 RepID=UPI001C2B94EF|nr:tripartite tricarboxylate transporter substrate binding protein [Noviherbaspirillum sp. L7-7A]MBV0881283.1 tripartite tricarboxylate transporter substrate binding protein [Noviherbaspirillum sp. L7-7A]